MLHPGPGPKLRALTVKYRGVARSRSRSCARLRLRNARANHARVKTCKNESALRVHSSYGFIFSLSI
jgi:hypothetical protein